MASFADDSFSTFASRASPDRSLYAILNVSPNATDDEIRRSYRQLATTYHPDKSQDESLHADATQAFHAIQEAYEILSDTHTRDIYDVYGLEGVKSGRELSVPGKSPEELRKDWEAARERQRRADVDAAVNFRGQYVFRSDATALITPYNRDLPRTPELRSVSMTSGIDIPIEGGKHLGPLLSADADVLHLGGFVYVRGEQGGGSFIAGYKRVYSDYTTLEMQSMVGLRTLVSVSSSVQLSSAANATIAASWQPNRGLGLQLITTRQLGDATHGELAWVVGPREEAGVALALTHRSGENTQLSGKLDVGAVTGITLRVARRIGEDMSARAGIKVSTSGIEFDVGVGRRLSELSTAGISVVTGFKKGVLVRLRYSRGGHSFEFPVQLSAGLDPRVLVGAHLLPPLIIYCASQWIIEPIRKYIEGRRVSEERKKRADEIEGAVGRAAAAAKLMAPVAKRKMVKEAAVNGLLIALALYGEEETVKASAVQRLQKVYSDAEKHKGENESEEKEGDGGGNGDEAQRDAPPYTFTTTPTSTESLPDAMIDVTTALQYLCDGTKITMHQGYSKSGLMGFCDPAPSSPKILLVFFTHQGIPYMAKISDTEGASLPGRGAPVADPQEAAMVVAVAKAVTEKVVRPQSSATAASVAGEA